MAFFLTRSTLLSRFWLLLVVFFKSFFILYLYGAGRKGGQKRSERTYPASTDKSVNQWQHLFTEIWHNDKPFMIAKLKDIPIERSLCAYSQKEFSRDLLAIVPFDNVVAHRERWMYLYRNRTFLSLRKS